MISLAQFMTYSESVLDETEFEMRVEGAQCES